MNLPYDRETMIAYFNEGKCPYCEKNGFKKIFTHMVKKHGISSMELKDALLINRSTGFLDPDTKEILSNNAIKNFEKGFKNLKGRVSGHTPSKITIQKQKLAWENNPEWQNHTKNLMKDPDTTKRMVETRKKNGSHKMLGQQTSVSVYGTIKGYADEVYVGFAIDFIDVINRTRGWGAYVHSGKKWGITETSAKKRVIISIKRGLLTVTGSYDSLRAELTEKAKQLLTSLPNEETQKYVNNYVERYRKL